MLVEDAMSTDIVSCEASATLQDAVESMLQERVGSVILTDDGTPAGIVTETDCLHAGYVTDRPFSEIPVRKVMSAPLVTIAPSKTIRMAVKRMDDRGVKKLVVVSDLDVVGVITASDLIRQYSEFKSEIHDLEYPHKSRAKRETGFDFD